MKIDTLVVGPVMTNCYIVSGGGEAVVIDPGWDGGRIISHIDKLGVTVKYIFLTHGHFDHILAVEEVRAATGAKVVIHRSDAHMLESPRGSLALNVRAEHESIQPDILAEDGDTFSACGEEFAYMNTPGHTPGSCVILCGKEMFSGDTLFATDCGRCDLPGGDYSQMLKSLKKLYELDGDYNVYPGHEESTTLSLERVRNANMLQAAGK